MANNYTSSFIPKKEPFYEGNDPRLQEEPCCATCHSRPESGLLCCSRCRAAWYCGPSCQKAHYKSRHKEFCLSLAGDLKRVEEEAIPLCNTPFADDPEPQNIFETHIGIFNEGPQTLAYMTARCELVESYFQAAHDVEIKEVWEKALFHALVLLREDASDPYGMRYVTPFILLYLNRDDDAYDFIRYWVEIGFVRDRDGILEMMLRHTNSKEGDWFYPREANSRFQDIFEECPEADDQVMLLSFLVALLIIKLRLVAAYDAACESIDFAFDETTGGQRIREVKDAVKDMLIDESVVNIDSQRDQIDQLFEVIHRNNPSMLPSILNPRPILSQPRPHPGVEGDPSEVYDVLNYCDRCFLRIPGARQRLVEMFGLKPTYNSRMQYID